MPKIHSSFAGQDDWHELLDEFVQSMPARIEQLVTAVNNQDLARLMVLVHQLRGACGSYGFETITHVAAEIEMAMRLGATIDTLTGPLTGLVDMLASITADTPDPLLCE